MLHSAAIVRAPARPIRPRAAVPAQTHTHAHTHLPLGARLLNAPDATPNCDEPCEQASAQMSLGARRRHNDGPRSGREGEGGRGGATLSEGAGNRGRGSGGAEDGAEGVVFGRAQRPKEHLAVAYLTRSSKQNRACKWAQYLRACSWATPLRHTRTHLHTHTYTQTDARTQCEQPQACSGGIYWPRLDSSSFGLGSLAIIIYRRRLY